MPGLIYACNTVAIAARFRKPIIRAAIAEGYDVQVLCGEGVNSQTYIKELVDLGAVVKSVPGMETDDMSVTQLRRQTKEIARIIEDVQPEILHSFTHRANIASFLAVRNRPGVRFIPNVTGAGRLFNENLCPRDKLARHILLRLYRAMGQRCECIFFQNADDLAEIGGYMRVDESKLRLTGGSGFDTTQVDLGKIAEVTALRGELASTYCIAPEKRIYLFPSRALRSKGVVEFYEAAARYLDLFDDAVFIHAGEDSDGPHGMSAAQLRSLERPGLHYVGFRSDIFILMQAAFAIVLPSAYREGVPRSLIEALCFGKLILTTDSPGCRETVIDGWNGKLFTPRSAHALLTALVMSRDIDSWTVAQNSQKLFRTRFNVDSVVSTYLEQYKNLRSPHA